MNFGESVKKEIIEKPIKEKCCKQAFLAGIIRGNGKLYEDEGELMLEFTLYSEELAESVAHMIRSVFDYEVRNISVYEDRLNKKDRIIFGIKGEKAEDILIKLGILHEDENGFDIDLKLFGKVTEKECCVRSFIKGLFLTCGSCTVPLKSESENTGYHLEMVFSHGTTASEIAGKLSEFNINAKIMRRKKNFIVYIKVAEDIKNFMAFIGASVSVLKLTDLMIEREMANKSNRQKNCDLGNVTRQIDAFERQIEAIEEIEKSNAFEELKPAIKETAIARKDYPDDTLSELAERLNITKSCLNHRLRKILSVAESLRQGK